MPVHLVLDCPRRRWAARIWRGMRTFIGTLMLVAGLATALPLGFAFFATSQDTSQNGAAKNFAGVMFALAIVALIVVFLGVWLIRGRRKLVLFLRRFGYSEATGAVTVAVAAIGRSWRLVTLDDAAIAPVGVPASVRRLFRAGHVAGSTIGRVWHTVVMVLMQAFGASTAGMLAVVVVTVLQHKSPLNLFAATQGSQQPAGWDVASAFRVLFVITLALAAAMLVMVLLTLPFIAFTGFYLFLSMSARAVREAEESKAITIATPGAIETTTSLVARQARKIFSSRLIVLKVVSELWRPAVRKLASAASVLLIDISEPTENLLWEIREVASDRKSRCVLVGHYEQVRKFAANTEAALSPATLAGRLSALIEGQTVLAYTTDDQGMKRFARSLRSMLEAAGG
jgi:hypothetical protein